MEELSSEVTAIIKHPRYFVHLAYDGTRYSGWQVQKNAPSVQETINAALHKLLNIPIRSVGCGRTDSGVHAKDFYMHFDSEKEILDEKDFLFRLNCVLPSDINVFRIFRVADNAHTRFDAFERTYEYYIYFDKSPFVNKYAAYHGFYQVDWQKVIAATDFLINIQDFTSLCLQSEDFKTNICYLKQIRWDVLPNHYLIHKPYEDGWQLATPQGAPNKGEAYRFTVTSNRFLRNMIRKIVGTAILVGKDKISLDEFKDTVSNKGTFKMNALAPPNGLFLSKIKYPYL